MRVNTAATGLSRYGQATNMRQPSLSQNLDRPLRQPATDSVRFGICPVCATGGALAVSGLVALSIKLLGGKPGDKPTCTAQSDASPKTTEPPSTPPQPQQK